MLRATGVEITTNGAVSVRGGQKPQGFYFAVPGDISSAAFFMVAAAILPNAEIELCGVSVNPSRTGIFDVFDQANVAYRAEAEKESLGEPVAAIHVRRGDCLRPFRVEGALVPRLIDELPVLAVLATQCEGTSVVRDATEMRVKESDRIEMVAAGLRAMGARIEVFPDGFAITGPTRLRAARIDARGDHRIAMAFAIAGLVADGNTVIDGAETITTSYPQFEEHLMSLCII
jgi:3-phosphoshikimate 1-carboxyvinyltransferase